MPATAFINGAYVLKLPSVMTAALALLVSSCCHSFVDRHSAPAASRGGAEHYPQRADGLLLHHLWLVEQIRSEQALLARLRAERKALQAGVPPQSKDKSACAAGCSALGRPMPFVVCRCSCARRRWLARTVFTPACFVAWGLTGGR